MLWVLLPGCAVRKNPHATAACAVPAGASRFLPADDESDPSGWERVRFLLYVVVPWLALYAFTSTLRLHGRSFGFAFEGRLPILSWTTIPYQSIYLTIALAPWLAKTRSDLRRLTLSCWTSMVVVFPFYWLVPSSAPRRPMLGNDWSSRLLKLERSKVPPIAAFPSFHVLWAVFLARMIRPRWIGWSYAGIIMLSCITTGQHYIPDVLLGLAISPVFVEPERTLGILRRLVRRPANSG